MSDRTGLGPLEVAVLRAVRDTGGGEQPVVTTRVLDRLELAERFGPSYGLRVLQHLGSRWNVPLRLLQLHGNWGTADGDPMADPQYTEVRLSPVGVLALAAEEEVAGPVPVDLVNGSLYRGGRVPPLDPGRATAVLRQLLDERTAPDEGLEGLVRLPTGGTFDGDLEALFAGRPVRMLLSCRISREETRRGRALVITGTPPGVGMEQIDRNLDERWRAARYPHRDRLPRHDEALAVDRSRVESSPDTDARLIVPLLPDSDLDTVERWLRGVWPVTIEQTWQLPNGIRVMFDHWTALCREDTSGINRLIQLLT